MHSSFFPFSAIVGQDDLKLGLLLNAVNPKVGGVLIRGEKGTAKSTAVRALAGILPLITTDFHGSAMSPFKQNVRVVDLPLNATEDRVAGGLDFSMAVKEGTRTFAPGLLAEADQGILYVDEVNLLDDHIVDIVLDAAASGENRVEREGISLSHPARFILIGTMNPEEGDLRPQFLDRFGLCVSVTGEKDIESRILLMKRREAFDRDRKAFIEEFRPENETLAQRIEKARRFLPEIRIPEHLTRFMADLCLENNVAGHRADLVLEQTVKALAALSMVFEVTLDHILKAAPMVFAHRTRDAQPPPPPEPDRDDEPSEPDNPDNNEQENQPPENGESREPNESNESNESRDQQPEPDESGETDDSSSQNAPMPEKNEERLSPIGDTYKVKPITSAKDRVFRRGSGKRSRTRVAMKKGRYVKSTSVRKNGDIALDATLRAAAPFQNTRKKTNGENPMAVILKDRDIREKIREKRAGDFLLFVVDASGSMGSRGRMAAAKGAVMSLLLDAYRKRDRVGMISFRRNEARVNLPPTPSVELAGKLLADMPVGGRTPLSAGLSKCYEEIRNAMAKDPTVRPVIILITDGKSNVSLKNGISPVEEALSLASAMAASMRYTAIVVDTEEQGMVRFGLARKLAAAMDADYVKIDDLKAEELIHIIKGRKP